MNWSKNWPEKPGYYWFRGDAPFDFEGAIIVELIEIDDPVGPYILSYETQYMTRLALFIGEWFGPIEVPA